jgi:hypothetical protein
MSERLKETLGLLENNGVEVKETPFYQEDGEVVAPRNGGAIIPFVPKEVATSIPEAEGGSDIRDDYVTSRNITHTLIDMAGQALEGALSVAIETQHPKAYTVFNELATTMRGLSKDLLEMQKIYKEITAEKQRRAEEAAAANAKTVNNNSVNINTTASLAEVMKMMREGKIPLPVGGTTVNEDGSVVENG